MRYLLSLSLLLLCGLPPLAVAAPPAPAKTAIVVPLGDSPSRGAADASVVMVEFIDFQ